MGQTIRGKRNVPGGADERRRGRADLTGPGPGRRPWTPTEAGLLLSFGYLVLLISLAGARLAQLDPGAPPPARTAADRVLAGVPARLVAQARPADRAGPTDRAGAGDRPVPPAPSGTGAAGVPAPTAAGPPAPAPAGAGSAAPVAASCVGRHTVPGSYAGAPGVEAPLAFGPPVEVGGPRSVQAVNGLLIQRLCGGIAEPGDPYRPPDRRLFVALDAMLTGRDPNRPIPRADWGRGVDRFITEEAQWTRATIVTQDAPAGTRTYGMRVRPGADPLVEATRTTRPTRSRYLVLPVLRADDTVVTLTLRLACGFQPTFPRLGPLPPR